MVRNNVREELAKMRKVEDTATAYKNFEGRIRHIDNYLDRMCLHNKVIRELNLFLRDNRNELNPEEILEITNMIDDICSGIYITDPELIDGQLFVNTLG